LGSGEATDTLKGEDGGLKGVKGEGDVVAPSTKGSKEAAVRSG
jgi:hypothetical protein